ncbi:LOW QUALITY PROTEIN: uncharacterized protein LOC133452172 [Cololabis saira]|uniref:LOW QUALITY PROTEIN: uncharacterized protein LOC133452172 n=1 Tax=Cololabis saira TaxID=129043 RepID=UPI002AD1FC41|nr:LOW QUALITY PROTEIN: uncharacterized protein LOC133452172 [Cololabis saira]
MFEEVKLSQSQLSRGEMAQKGVQLDQETFSCSICLEVLKDPVTIPCGHSYCMNCINNYWDEGEKKLPSCPQCRKTFIPKPVLVKSTILADLVEQMKKTGLQAAPADHCYAGPEDVACDFCSGRKLKAVKSCLVCLASYCENHLQPHHDSSTFKKHKLVDPSKNLQDNICPRHDEVMKMFCRTDQKCICYLCSVDEHKGHDTVTAAAERTERQREMEVSRQQIQQEIQDREKDVKLLQQEVEAINQSADKTVEDSEEIFTELISLLQKRSSDVKQQIRSQQESEVRRVRELEEKLQQEITDLKRRDAEVKQLSDIKDNNQFLHNYPSLSPLSESTHSSSISIRPLRYFQDVTAAVSEVRGQLQDILRDMWTNISLTITDVDVLLSDSQSEPKSRAGFLKYSCEITLDPNTVKTSLLLSEENRKVTYMEKCQSYSDHPDRFTTCSQVLSRESLTGRHYWEVEKKAGGVEVAVSYKNISRSGDESGFGFNDKSWSLGCSSDSYVFWYNTIQTSISGPQSSRIGVYLDHRAGVLSFYSVSETMTLLHRVQTTFTQPLHAGVWVGLTDGASAEFFQPQINPHKLQALMESCSPAKHHTNKDCDEPAAFTEVKLSQSQLSRGEMAQKGLQLDQETFSCSICLDLLKDPVTIPCGHSYCMNCINKYWDEGEKKLPSCPQCRKTFIPKPVLVKSTILADLVEQMKKTGLQAAPADHCYAGPEDVACDFCSGRKLKAVKSCLVCLASYCENHLQPHHDSSTFKKHKLVDPSKNLQDNICPRHDEVMKMFCRTDQKCICYLCPVDEHKGHDTVSAAAERTERQREMEVSRQQIQQKIQDREKDVKLLQQEVEAVNQSADKTVEDSEEIFTELISLLQKRSSGVKQQVRSQQETEVRRVRELEEKLQQEITHLKRRDAEMKHLTDIEDHNQFLHNYPSLSPLSESTHSSSISIRPLSYFEDVTAAVSEVRGQLQDILRDMWTNISLTITDVDVLLSDSQSEPKSRAGFLKYSCEITLDPNTADKELLLSEENRKVTFMDEDQSYSDHPDRFTEWSQVLSRESLTGRQYWEVEKKADEVDVAVSYKNISRSGDESLFGCNDKSWSLDCSSDSYVFWYNDIKTSISGPLSSRIGVYLDHRAGVLSFYSVSETMTLLHRVQTTFTQPLYAGVYVGDTDGNSAEFCKLK